MAEWRISLSEPNYGKDEQLAVRRVLASNWLSSGPEVNAFQVEFAKACGVPVALAVSSATAALHLALLSAGVGPGDEVVQPALNFVACANMTRALGAAPRWADIEALDRPTICASAAERVLSPRTKAVVVMHYGGTPAPMGDLVTLCRERAIPLIEDACHALGTTYGRQAPNGWAERPVGGLGDYSCFSFFGNKNLVTGEGGMLTVSDPDRCQRLHRLRSHGMDVMSWDKYGGHSAGYDVQEPGFNYRMDDLRASIGRAQLAALPTNCTRRLEHLARYWAEFTRLPSWTVPFAQAQRPTAAHLMVVLAPTAEIRAEARRRLHEARIQTSLHYPPVPSLTAHRHQSDPVPHTFAFAERALTLPLHARLPDGVPSEVVDILAGIA